MKESVKKASEGWSMIPKKIHYCWFGGGEKPDAVLKCIASWKKICPDYEIVEWNEENFDVYQTPYLQYCYENRKWAFLSDLARLIIVYQYGGLYFDTDVELVKRPDDLLENGAFYGFENSNYIATGLGFGAEKNHPTVQSMIQQYEQMQPDAEGKFELLSCPQLNTRALLLYGLQCNGEKQLLGDTLILPVDYMNPYDDPTGVLNCTKSTISIHWYSKSWLSRGAILRSKLTKPFHRFFGNDCFRWLKRK